MSIVFIATISFIRILTDVMTSYKCIFYEIQNLRKPISLAISSKEINIKDFFMKKQRNSNIELLRIVLMTMIVIWHYIMHGLNMKSPSLFQEQEWNNYVMLFTSSSLCFPVNCFIFITGYFGISLQKGKIIRYVIMLLTYSIIAILAGVILNFDIQWYNILQAFLPISSNRWWFFTSYFYLMLLSPFLNSGSSLLSKSSFLNLLIVLFITFYSISLLALGHRFIDLNLFIFIYLVGRYFNRFNLKIFDKHAFLICVLSLLAMWGITFLSVFTRSAFILYRIWYYHNPILLILAISVFFIFYNMKEIKININWISSGVFATYLLTDSVYLREWYNKIVVLNIPPILWLVTAVVTVVICCMFGFCRAKLTDKLLKIIKI